MTIEIPPPLFEVLANRECVVMLGAGFSAGAGLPTGADLARVLAEAIQRPELGDKPLSDVAEHVVESHGRPYLERKIADVLGEKERAADRSIFQLFGKIVPPTYVITTNYDKLLEETLGRDSVCVIHTPKEISRHSDPRINLYKIHGDLDSLHDATITKTDYARYSQKYPQFVELLGTLFRQRSVVFVGYSADDWDFLAVHLKVLDEMGESKKPCYAVSPSSHADKLAHLKNLQIRHIQGTALDFFRRLADEQVSTGTNEREPEFWKSRPKLPSPTDPLVIERNPFTVFRAEDMSDELWENHLFQEPRLYNIYADSISRGNTVIEGHRGSGKSMLLLSMSYPIQRILGKNPEFVGLYVKIQKPVFVSAERRRLGRDEWTDYFLSFFNLVIAEEFLKFLDRVAIERNIPDDTQRRMAEALSKLFPDIKATAPTLLDLHDDVHSLRISQGRAPPRPSLGVPGDLVSSMMSRVRRFLPDWEHKPLYILLDEFDRLVPDQQQVANLLLTPRGPTYKDRVYYKVGVKSYEGTQVTIDGTMLEAPDDYVHVYLDRLHPDNERKESQYLEFVETMANERLVKIWKYGITIRDLLPAGTGSYRDGDYAGFDNIAALSSFLPRDFLEVCKDIIFYGYPDLLKETKPETLAPVMPRVQNSVISIHAYKMLQDLNRITDERDRPHDRARSEDAIRLIESLGRIFRTIHDGSKSAEARTVSEIIVIDEGSLAERSRLAIMNCLKTRALRIPLTTRPAPNPSKPNDLPGSRYELHRLLCAHYRLSLARRWPKRISARWIDELLSSQNPTDQIRELTAYFIKNGDFPSHHKTKLDEFPGD